MAEKCSPSEQLQAKWTCYVCHEKADIHSIPSLESQEQAAKSKIFVDGSYRQAKLVVTYQGSKYLITCSRAIADLVLSDSTDPAVKQDIMESLIRQSNSQVGNKSATLTEAIDSCTGDKDAEDVQSETTEEKEDGLQEKEAESSSNCSQVPVFHVWKEKEEDYLVHLRHEKHDDFTLSRNHNKLWMEIVEQLKEIKCNVTPQQALNKYNSLKKKWKEIIDSPSGSETKYFRHKTSFDIMFGNKASTKPAATIDSMSTSAINEENTGVKKDNHGKGKVKKRKCESSTEVIQILKDQYSDFKSEIANQHDQKMARMDRLLDLYEKEINQKNSTN